MEAPQAWLRYKGTLHLHRMFGSCTIQRDSRDMPKEKGYIGLAEFIFSPFLFPTTDVKDVNWAGREST